MPAVPVRDGVPDRGVLLGPGAPLGPVAPPGVLARRLVRHRAQDRVELLRGLGRPDRPSLAVQAGRGRDADRDRQHDHRDREPTGHREVPPREGPHDASPPDRLLHPPLRRGREGDRDPDEDEALPQRQRDAQRDDGDHEDRPVPQVERVGDAAEEPRDRGPQAPRRSEPRRPRPGHDDERGSHGGQECRHAGKRGRLADRDGGDRDEGDAGPPRDRGRRARDPLEPRPCDREQSAEAELPGTRRQREEGPGLVDGRQPEGEDERDHADRRDDRPDPSTGPERASRDDEDDDRPEQVELLLHAEGPEVEDRRRGLAGREVVGRLRRESHVGDEQRGRGRVRRGTGHEERRKEDDGDRDGHEEDDGGRRQDAARSSRVERWEGERPRLTDLAEHEAGDEEPRDHEEDVDARKPAREPRDGCVEEDHEQDGDRPEPLDVRPTPPGRGDGPPDPVRHRRAAVDRVGHGDGSSRGRRLRAPAGYVPATRVSLVADAPPAGVAARWDIALAAGPSGTSDPLAEIAGTRPTVSERITPSTGPEPRHGRAPGPGRWPAAAAYPVRPSLLIRATAAPSSASPTASSPAAHSWRCGLVVVATASAVAVGGSRPRSRSSIG